MGLAPVECFQPFGAEAHPGGDDGPFFWGEVQTGADAETVAGVTATAHELFACYNANAYLQVFGLFTDEYLARSFAEEGMTEEALGYFSMPADVRPPEERESVGVQEVQVLADGRVGAFLEVRNPEAGDATFMDYTIFVEQDGRYVIDYVIFLPAEGE